MVRVLEERQSTWGWARYREHFLRLEFHTYMILFKGFKEIKYQVEEVKQHEVFSRINIDVWLLASEEIQWREYLC
jgi:hypothetical protein